jgi:hypothetical protein
MPSQVVELSKLCLHDGEILQRQEQEHPFSIWGFYDRPGSPPFWPVWYGVATLAVRHENELVTLFYFLCDHVAEHPAAEDWPFSKKREHWLYDEVHWQGDDRGRFMHLILFSSGVVLTIPFATVLISQFSLSPVSTKTGKQSAWLTLERSPTLSSALHEVDMEILNVNDHDARPLFLSIDPLAALWQRPRNRFTADCWRSRRPIPRNRRRHGKRRWNAILAALAGPPSAQAVCPAQYLVLVTCRDEKQRVELLERLGGEGLKCKDLLS